MKVIIASTAAAIVEVVERNVREVCPDVVVERALDEVDFYRCIGGFERGLIFLEANFCEIATAYLMAKKLSDNPELRFVIFSFEKLPAQDMGRFYNLGAEGFLNFRSKDQEEWQRGIFELLRGNEYISKEAEKTLKDFRVGRTGQPAFTIREIQVLRHTARGRSIEEIAELLSITPRSVQNVKTQVYQKAGIKNNVQIMLFGLSMGYVSLDELLKNYRGLTMGLLVRTKRGEFGVDGIATLVELLREEAGVKGKGVVSVADRADVELVASVPFVAAMNNEQGGTEWTLSTFDLDRFGERIDPAGWDFKRYMNNPVVEWAHRHDVPAIGKIEGLTADDRGLHGAVVFNDREYDPFGWAIGERVKRGVIRAGSVGFRVIEIELPDKETARDGTALIFRRQELLEFSVCNVPANPFALAKGFEGAEEASRSGFWGGLINEK